jgi:hypothetical protein
VLPDQASAPLVAILLLELALLKAACLALLESTALQVARPRVAAETALQGVSQFSVLVRLPAAHLVLLDGIAWRAAPATQKMVHALLPREVFVWQEHFPILDLVKLLPVKAVPRNASFHQELAHVVHIMIRPNKHVLCAMMLAGR